MADTLLAVVKRVCRKVGLDPTITSFSDTDESNDVVQDVNDAYFELVRSLPKDTPYLVDISGTVTTSNGTRLYSLGASARLFNILEWSVENETNEDNPIEVVPLQYVQDMDSQYDEKTGVPTKLYREGNEQIGLYPVPDGTYAINYKFTKTYTRLSTTTDVFIVPDEWLRFVEKKAQYLYEDRKGFGSPEETYMQAEDILAEILAEAEMMNPRYFVPETFY